MDRVTYWLERSSLYVALSAAWIAMCGSLYFSEVAGYIPCKFCWYQRILMYPLAVIIAVGLWRRDRHLPFYVLPLSVVGIGVSTYHYLLQKTDIFSGLSTCQVGVPCSGIWINWLGFITIPFLALIAFFVITIMSVIALQAGEPADDFIDDDFGSDEVDSDSATAVPQSSPRTWFPIVVIIVVIVIVFWLLGRMGTSATDEHASTDFSVIESGAQTLIDGTTIDSGDALDSGETLAKGRDLYEEACAACHGPNGEGVTGLGSALTTSPLLQQADDRELLATIRSGLDANDPHNESGIAMPGSGGRPELSDEEITQIIQYLRTRI